MTTNGTSTQVHTTVTQRHLGQTISWLVIRLLIAFIISWLIVLAFFVTGVVSH